MERVFVVAAAVLLATGAGLTGKVIAAGTGQSTQPAAVSTDPSVVPEFLKTVPMYSTDPGLNIDVPIKGAVYPPDIIPPQFTWRDDNPAATVWRIEIVFPHGHPLKIWSNGDKMQLSELDTTLKGYVPPTLTPQQAAAHTWRPDVKTWEEIKKQSVGQPLAALRVRRAEAYEVAQRPR